MYEYVYVVVCLNLVKNTITVDSRYLDLAYLE